MLKGLRLLAQIPYSSYPKNNLVIKFIYCPFWISAIFMMLDPNTKGKCLNTYLAAKKNKFAMNKYYIFIFTSLKK